GRLAPPLAEHLEGVPERRLRRLLVERLVDVRRDEPLDRGRELLELALDQRELAREREADRVEEGDRGHAHRDHELRLNDVQLAEEERPRLLLVTAGELEAVRPVDRHRIDVQALQRLEERVAGAAVEGDSLLQLRRLRRVLEEEDVGERMAGAENRDANSSGPLKRRIRTAPVPTPARTCASDPAPGVRLYLRAKRSASSLYASKSSRALYTSSTSISARCRCSVAGPGMACMRSNGCGT